MIPVEGGRVTSVDEAAIKAEARELSREFKQELQRTATSAAALEPYYREMYLRSVGTEVEMNRWLPTM
jgi:5-methylthioadenosine/S-adenosylhomocysteine deaminase